MHLPTRTVRLGACVLAVVAGLAVVFTAPAHAAAVVVKVGPTGAAGYNPNGRTDRVSPGQAIDWTWAASSGSHTVTFADGPTSPVQSKGTFTRTFNSAGTYSYHCQIHGEMTGSVVVETSATTAPTTAKPPPTTASKPPPTTVSRGGTTATTTKASSSPATTNGGAPVGATAASTAVGGAGSLPAASAGDTSTTVSSKSLAVRRTSDNGSRGHVGAWLVIILVLVAGGGTALWFALRRRATG